MRKYIVEVSENATQDLENILRYLRYKLAGDIIVININFYLNKNLKI